MSQRSPSRLGLKRKPVCVSQSQTAKPVPVSLSPAKPVPVFLSQPTKGRKVRFHPETAPMGKKRSTTAAPGGAQTDSESSVESEREISTPKRVDGACACAWHELVK